ncbi:hypothetical protein GCM10009812_14120 [Nocardioides marinus]
MCHVGCHTLDGVTCGTLERVLTRVNELRGDPTMKTRLSCPCGTVIKGQDEDDLVEKTQAHLAAEHPGMSYGRDEILFIAT